MKIIQIGTNNGNDFVNQFVKSNIKDIELLILVEPNPSMNEKIRQNYEGIEFTLENVVISESDGYTTFYTHDKEHGHDSLSKAHVVSCEHPEEEVKEVTYPCLTINSLFEKHNVKKVDYLFIDTEGFDVVIINSIDFNKYDVGTIIFEHYHSNGYKSSKAAKYSACVENLTKHGYVYRDLNTFDTIATKNDKWI